MFRIDRATEVSLALVVTMVVVGIAALQPRSTYVAPLQVVQQQPSAAVTNDDDDDDTAEVTPPAPAQQSAAASHEPILQVVKVRLNMGLEEGRKQYAGKAMAFAQAEPAPTRQASLPPVTVQAPKVEPKKVQQAWTATLPERQEIARSYLEKNCKAILTLEKMQSAASKQDTDARFMKAKSPGQIIGTIKAQLREHPIVVGQFCPTEFHNQLFAKK